MQAFYMYPTILVLLYLSVYVPGTIYMFPSSSASVLHPGYITRQTVIAHWLGPGAPVESVFWNTAVFHGVGLTWKPAAL
jgi:hypothetical protein